MREEEKLSFGLAMVDDMKRQTLFSLCSMLISLGFDTTRAEPSTPAVNLLSAPLEVNGTWGESSPKAATVVISRMRQACLSALRLLFDHQPDRLRVDDQSSGPPHIWLHKDNPTTARRDVRKLEADYASLLVRRFNLPRSSSSLTGTLDERDPSIVPQKSETALDEKVEPQSNSKEKRSRKGTAKVRPQVDPRRAIE